MQESMDNTDGKTNKNALADTACRELLTYGLWDNKTRVKRWIKKYLLKRQTAPEDLIFWPTGLLAAGLWQYRQEMASGLGTGTEGEAGGEAAQQTNKAQREATGQTGGAQGEAIQQTDKAQSEAAGQTGRAQDEAVRQIDKALSAYYGRWINCETPIWYLDDLLAGEVLLSAYVDYSQSGRGNGIVTPQNADTCWEAVGKLAAYGIAYPTDEMGSFPYRAAQNNGQVFVDAVGLACPFLYRYGVECGRADVMELAVKQIVNFLAYGMDGSTGLPYHGYVMRSACKYGIIGWGRAVGWLLRGMVGCMATEYGLTRLGDSYVGLVDAAVAHQRKDGYFSWQLQAADGPADTSATGMICGAVKQGIGMGILTKTDYARALQAGRSAIGRSVKDGGVYDCSGECEGFGQYPQRYGAYPWSLGPALLL